MSAEAEAGPSQPVQQAGKKRKRTGKEREERKQAAILAAQTKADEEGAVPAEPEHQDEAQVAEAPASSVDFAILEKRLPRALTHLRHVFKKAKIIEMTRLIKKIKTSRSKGGDEAEVADLESQRQIMAHINLSSTLSSHLHVNIRKHRLLKHTPSAIPSSIVDLLSTNSSESSNTDATRKVENRLCSSKVVAQEMKSAVAWLMNEESAKLGPGVKAEPPKAKEKIGASRTTKLKGKTVRAKDGHGSADENQAEEGVDEDMSVRMQVVVDSDDEDADAAGWESGSVSGDDLPNTSRRSIDIAAPDSDDDETVSLSPEPVTEKTKTKTKPKPEAARQSKALTSSTFLPSLSTGFTRGDSDDSDPDDDFGEGLEDIIGKGTAGVRKNRRGQRARQLIWERKYGKNAKHVQKAQAQQLEGNIANAYGKRAGAVKSSSAAGPARPVPTSTPTPAIAPSVPTTFDKPRFGHTAPAVDKPATGLHPSWEAARLRKQKEATGPKATKIVFD